MSDSADFGKTCRDVEGGIDFPDLMRRAWEKRFTGTITLHFGSGVPNNVSFPEDAVWVPLRRSGIDRRETPRPTPDRRRS
jgi:hypothetical protein